MVTGCMVARKSSLDVSIHSITQQVMLSGALPVAGTNCVDVDHVLGLGQIADSPINELLKLLLVSGCMWLVYKAPPLRARGGDVFVHSALPVLRGRTLPCVVPFIWCPTIAVSP